MRNNPKFKHHKYYWTHEFSWVRHKWELVGPDGGVHFAVSINDEKKYSISAGLEFHFSARSCRTSGAPDHTQCPLIGEPCWHDGTSLYATESLWPIIEGMLQSADHDAIFRTLEREYERVFEEKP